jgi:hypothetical protein
LSNVYELNFEMQSKREEEQMNRLKPFFGLCLMLCLTASVGLASGNMMSVQIKKGVMRSTPSYLGKPVKNISYGKQVEVLGKKGKWINVAYGSRKGWMNEAALTSKKIIMKAGASDAALAASSNEVALAGKGFNKQVESKYKSDNPNSKKNYREVDRLEKKRVSQREIQRFMKAGQLKLKGGV